MTAVLQCHMRVMREALNKYYACEDARGGHQSGTRCLFSTSVHGSARNGSDGRQERGSLERES